jgi:hypothetical protein
LDNCRLLQRKPSSGKNCKIDRTGENFEKKNNKYTSIQYFSMVLQMGLENITLSIEQLQEEMNYALKVTKRRDLGEAAMRLGKVADKFKQISFWEPFIIDDEILYVAERIADPALDGKFQKPIIKPLGLHYLAALIVDNNQVIGQVEDILEKETIVGLRKAMNEANNFLWVYRPISVYGRFNVKRSIEDLHFTLYGSILPLPTK